MGNTALHAYLETADPIDSDTAIALLDIELAEAAQGAAPLSNTFDNSGVSVKSIDLAAPRAEGWGVQDDGLDVERLARAMCRHYHGLSLLDCPMIDWHRNTAEALADADAASPLNASGDER